MLESRISVYPCVHDLSYLSSESKHQLDYSMMRKCFLYWVVQVGWLTPLTFARHHLSPMVAFTSGVYFLHSGRW